MNDFPKVSICIPTYNRCQYLKQTIESALAQDYPNLEVVVSDNASTDDTINVVKSYSNDLRFSYHRNGSNEGMVANWRILLYELVTGDWFIMLSDDDYLVDHAYISKAVSLSQRDIGINLIYANGYIHHADRNETTKLNIPYDFIENGINIFLKKHRVVPQEYTLCNVMFNTDISKQLEAFSNLDNVCCDMELFLKICLLGKVGVIKDYASVYRYHDNNLINKKRSYRDLVAVTDIFIEPYKYAKLTNKIDKNELKIWKKKVFDPAMKDILFCLSIDCADEFNKGMDLLCTKADDNLSRYFLDPIFMLKILMTKNKWVYEKVRSIKKKLGKKA